MSYNTSPEKHPIRVMQTWKAIVTAHEQDPGTELSLTFPTAKAAIRARFELYAFRKALEASADAFAHRAFFMKIESYTIKLEETTLVFGHKEALPEGWQNMIDQLGAAWPEDTEVYDLAFPVRDKKMVPAMVKPAKPKATFEDGEIIPNNEWDIPKGSVF